MKLKTIIPPLNVAAAGRWHTLLLVEGVQVPANESNGYFCGESHCRGTCGYPGLFARWEGRELKAHSNMVAVGRVWQEKPWTGERLYVPDDVVPSVVNLFWR